MLFVKLLGTVTVLASGGFAALCAVRYEKRRLTVTDGWCDLILYIRGQIDCFLKPLDEILRDGDEKMFAACMYHGETPSAESIFRASEFYLDRECAGLLSSFVREIGGSYREEQLRRCDYYLDALRQRRDRIAAELTGKTRIAVTLCLCAALGAVILLW